MTTMMPLIEYLLASRSSSGSSLVRHSIIGVRGIFPPNYVLDYYVYPRDDGYANIIYGIRFSPDIVPQTMSIASFHEGMMTATGPFGPADIEGDLSLWILITQSQPMHVTQTNLTPLLQILDYSQVHLVISNEEDFKRVWDIIAHWGFTGHLEDLIREQTEVLRAIAQGTPPPPAGAREPISMR